MIVDEFQWVFSEALLNAYGNDVKLGLTLGPPEAW